MSKKFLECCGAQKLQNILPVLSEFSTEESLNEFYLLKDERQCESTVTKTKVICTIGPTCNSAESMYSLLKAGMSLARFNLSHNSLDNHEKFINRMREASKKAKQPCAIVVDTRGCAIRMAETTKREPVCIQKGQSIKVAFGDINKEKSGSKIIFVNQPGIEKMLRANDIITIGFGLAKLKVKSIQNKEILCEVLTNATLSCKKTVFLPKGRKIRPGKVSKEDIEDLKFASKVKADFVAASYVTSGEEVRNLKREILKNGGKDIKLIAKIECQEALENFCDILEEADAIHISRGNLGEEIEPEAVTFAQKLVLNKCNAMGKPAIIATQILESMRTNPFPTRAEASDAGNAVFDGADNVELSGETAEGSYPKESARMLGVILKEAERSVDHKHMFRFVCDSSAGSELSSEEAVASAAVKLSYDLRAAVVIAFSSSGLTGRLISKYRPKCPILLVTETDQAVRHALISRGVVPMKTTSKHQPGSPLSKDVLEALEKHCNCHEGDRAVVVHVETKESKNMLRVVDLRFQ